MPAYSHSIRSFHSTHKPLQASIYIHQNIKSHHSIISTHSSIQQPSHSNTNFFSQCLPCSSSLLALVLPQTGLFLLFPSEPSITSDDFEQSHHHTNVSRGEPACTPDVHISLFIYQLPTSSTAPALTRLHLGSGCIRASILIGSPPLQFEA